MLNKDVLSLIRLSGWTIQVTYIYCEANTYTDALALRKHDVDFYLHVLDAVPASISFLLDPDSRGDVPLLLCLSLVLY
jgi:hypothetical protein